MGILQAKIQENWGDVISFTIIWVLPLLVSVGLVFLGYQLRGSKKQEYVKQKSDATTDLTKGSILTDTLTAMHRRLIEIQKEKVTNTKITLKQFQQFSPFLADSIGIIKLKEWPKFIKAVKRKIRRKVGLQIFKRPMTFIDRQKYKEYVYLIGSAIAKEMVNDLGKNKEWVLDDAVRISDCLEGQHWGIKAIRDSDPQWLKLYESIRLYLGDTTLSKLIQKHMDASYMYNSLSVLIEISHRWPKDAFAAMLHNSLIGSGISPVKMDIALSEVLSEIENRLLEIEEATQTQSPKAKITAELPASSLTPAVKIVRHEYVLGQPRTMRIEYVASSTDVLLNFQREAKIRIEQGNFKEEISPVSIAPGQYGTIASSADYRIPEWMKGDIKATPIIATLDGSRVENKPYIIHI